MQLSKNLQKPFQKGVLACIGIKPVCKTCAKKINFRVQSVKVHLMQPKLSFSTLNSVIQTSAILKTLTDLFEDPPAFLLSLSNHFFSVPLFSLYNLPPVLKHVSSLHPVPAGPEYAHLARFLSHPTTAKHKRQSFINSARLKMSLYVCLSAVPVVEADMPPHTVCIREIQYRGFPPGRAL